MKGPSASMSLLAPASTAWRSRFLSRDIFAPIAAGPGRARRPRAPGGEARAASWRRLPPSSRPIIVDAIKRQKPGHRSAINGKAFLG